MEYESDLWEGFVQEDEWAEYSREETPQDRAGENTDSESGLPSKYGGSIWD